MSDTPRSPDRRRRWRAVATCVVAVGVLGGVGGVEARQAPRAVSHDPLVTVAVSPYRVLDTRLGVGVGGSTSPLGPGGTIDVQITGVGPVPANAVAAVINLTASQVTEAGYVTAWPTGEERPTTSVLNLTPGQDIPNMVTVALGDGKLSLFNFTGSVHLIADIAAYLIPSTGGVGPQGPPGPPGTPPTQTLLLWGTQFVAESAAWPIRSSGHGCVDNPDSDGAAAHLYLELPAGSSITAVRLGYKQPNASSIVQLELRRIIASSGFEAEGSEFASTAGATGSRTGSLNIGSPPAVSANAMYMLRGGMWSSGAICRVEVDYTLPPA